MRVIQFVFLIVLIVVPQLHGQYTYVDIHPEGYDTSQALGIHNGNIVGWGWRGNTTPRALLWQGISHTIVDLQPIWATLGSIAFATYDGK